MSNHPLFYLIYYSVVINNDFFCCSKPYILRKRERKKEKLSVSFVEEEKFPYWHNSELVMDSVITQVLSNNVKVNAKVVYSNEVFNPTIP